MGRRKATAGRQSSTCRPETKLEQPTDLKMRLWILLYEAKDIKRRPPRTRLKGQTINEEKNDFFFINMQSLHRLTQPKYSSEPSFPKHLINAVKKLLGIADLDYLNYPGPNSETKISIS